MLETAESFSVTNCNECKRHNKKQEQKDESKKPRCNVELEVHSRGLFVQKGVELGSLKVRSSTILA